MKDNILSAITVIMFLLFIVALSEVNVDVHHPILWPVLTSISGTYLFMMLIANFSFFKEEADA